MDDATILQELVRQFDVDRDIVARHELYHDDAVVEFPQSGERFVGKTNFLTWRAKYPAPVDYRLRRISGHGDLWFVELLASYDGSPPKLGLAMITFRGDRIARETIYVMEGFDAAAWRDEWVTRFDPLASIVPTEWQAGTPFPLDA